MNIHSIAELLDRCITEFLVSMRPHDARASTIVIVIVFFCAGVACIEKCYVEFLCILHRPRDLGVVDLAPPCLKHKKKGQSWSRARSSRTLGGRCREREREGKWLAMIFFCFCSVLPYDTRNIPINMHATTINNYARDQNRTSPLPLPSSSSSYSYCFGWSSDCNWNDNQDDYDDDYDDDDRVN